MRRKRFAVPPYPEVLIRRTRGVDASRRAPHPVANRRNAARCAAGRLVLHSPDWSTSSARQAYREGELSKAEYEVILKQLKAEHQARLAALREQWQQQDLTREEYLQKVKEAKQDYTGVEDCGSWLGC